MLRIIDSGSIGPSQGGPRPKPEQPLSSLVHWAPIAAGLASAAFIAWIRCPVPPPHLLSWGDLFTFAAAPMLATCIAGSMGVLITYAILGCWAGTDVPGVTWRTMVACVWFVPLAVFLAETSTWALAASTALAASVTLLISRRATIRHEETEAPVEPGLFQLRREPPAVRRMLPALCASVSVQTGALAAVTGHLLPATALSGAGTAVIAWRWSDETQRPSQQSTGKAAWIFALAAILTCGGLTHYLAPRRRFGGQSGGAGQSLASVTDAVLRSIFNGKASRKASSTGREGASVTLGSIYSGIILLPESQPYATIVPPLPALRAGLPLMGRVNPLSIPFFGAYWLFKAPDTSPPPSSIHARGNPAEHTFTSTDHAPLFMEAHQDFGVLLNLSCCRAVQIAVSNADRYFGTVSLELIVVNSRLPGSASQSLGSQRLESTLRWRPGDDGQPLAETLTYPVPANCAVREFDQAIVRFQLAAMRADIAAKTAIERFVLVPR